MVTQYKQPRLVNNVKPLLQSRRTLDQWSPTRQSWQRHEASTPATESSDAVKKTYRERQDKCLSEIYLAICELEGQSYDHLVCGTN